MHHDTVNFVIEILEWPCILRSWTLRAHPDEECGSLTPDNAEFEICCSSPRLLEHHGAELPSKRRPLVSHGLSRAAVASAVND